MKTEKKINTYLKLEENENEVSMESVWFWNFSFFTCILPNTCSRRFCRLFHKLLSASSSSIYHRSSSFDKDTRPRILPFDLCHKRIMNNLINMIIYIWYYGMFLFFLCVFCTLNPFLSFLFLHFFIFCCCFAYLRALCITAVAIGLPVFATNRTVISRTYTRTTWTCLIACYRYPSWKKIIIDIITLNPY